MKKDEEKLHARLPAKLPACSVASFPVASKDKSERAQCHAKKTVNIEEKVANANKCTRKQNSVQSSTPCARKVRAQWSIVRLAKRRERLCVFVLEGPTADTTNLMVGPSWGTQNGAVFSNCVKSQWCPNGSQSCRNRATEAQWGRWSLHFDSQAKFLAARKPHARLGLQEHPQDRHILEKSVLIHQVCKTPLRPTPTNTCPWKWRSRPGRTTRTTRTECRRTVGDGPTSATYLWEPPWHVYLLTLMQDQYESLSSPPSGPRLSPGNPWEFWLSRLGSHEERLT